MKYETGGPTGAIGHSLITATYAGALADGLLALIEGIVRVSRRIAAQNRGRQA